MIEKPSIVRLDEVARVVPLPLSASSINMMRSDNGRCVYLDNTKTDAVIKSKSEVLAIDSKAKSYAILTGTNCIPEYMQYILNTVPVKKYINEFRATRSLSTFVLNGQPVPMIPIEIQHYVARIEDLIHLMIRKSEWDPHAELGEICLREISMGVNTELFINELCEENHISIIDRWIEQINAIPNDEIGYALPRTLLSSGNILMAEVRALQRILIHAREEQNYGL